MRRHVLQREHDDGQEPIMLHHEGARKGILTRMTWTRRVEKPVTDHRGSKTSRGDPFVFSGHGMAAFLELFVHRSVLGWTNEFQAGII